MSSASPGRNFKTRHLTGVLHAASSKKVIIRQLTLLCDDGILTRAVAANVFERNTTPYPLVRTPASAVAKLSTELYFRRRNIYNIKRSPVTGLEWPRVFQEVKVPRFHDNGTGRWLGCQPYAPAAFTSRKFSWYSFLLEAESTPGP